MSISYHPPDGNCTDCVEGLYLLDNTRLYCPNGCYPTIGHLRYRGRQ